MTPQTNDDYDPNAMLKKLDANLHQPDKFAAIFCSAAASQKSVDDVIKNIIRNLLSTDTITRETLKHLVNESIKEDNWYYIKKTASSGWSIALIVIGIIIEKLLSKWI